MPLSDPALSRAVPPHQAHDPALTARSSGRLGEREREVLEVMLADGEATVSQVTSRLSLPLAYTTVMTTLDRLFKKGLLRRVKQDRAFVYSPAVSRDEFESLRARALLERFFDNSASSPDVLLSCLVDALGYHDDALLCRLEDKIRAAKLNATPDQPSQPPGTKERS